MTATQNNSRPLNGRRSQMTMGPRGREEREGRATERGKAFVLLSAAVTLWCMGAREGSGRAGEGGDIGTGPVRSQENSEMRRLKHNNKAARMGQKRSKKALTNCDQSPKRRTYEGWC